MTSSADTFDAIVVGSGIGGLAAAAALAKRGRRVLVLEQHVELGGLTQTFVRREYRFATGVHYIGGVGAAPGPRNQLGHLLRWLTDGRLRFASIGSPYDVVRLPGFEFPVEAPRAAYVARLKAVFPDEGAAIDRYFLARDEAEYAAMAMFAQKALPPLLAAPWRWLNARRVQRALGTTTAQAVRAFKERRLANVLTATWGDYAVVPERSPFPLHALVTGSYFDGAYYPVGGPARFAQTLGDTVSEAGGECRSGSRVAQFLVDRGRASGVRLTSGESLHAPWIVSAMGARNTAAALPAGVAGQWRDAVARLAPSSSYIALYLGLRGDIREHGASAANVWIFETDDIAREWAHPADEAAPAMFVSFPSLKDPAHADPLHHTAEVIAMCNWEHFSPWSASAPGHRPEEYHATKAWIAEALLAQFKRHFPQLASMVDLYELSTPLSQASYVLAERGAMYGLEMSAERMRHPGLRVRTPVPGLLLAGQDVASPGVAGAFIGGFMAAACVEPRLWIDVARQQGRPARGSPPPSKVGRVGP